MTGLTIKEKILKLLLESSKTTGEIAKELGYVDKNGMGKYNNIKADLNTLQSYGFIHYSKTKKQGIPGPVPTTYEIVYEISILREMLQKYPSLISDLPKNERILTMLANEFYKNLPEKLLDHEQFKSEIRVFAHYLKGSRSFFKLVLLNSPETLIGRFDKIYAFTRDGIYRQIIEDSIKKKIEGKQPLKALREESLKTKFPSGLTLQDKKTLKLLQEFNDSVFESCVKSDILKGVYNQSSIDYITKKNEAEVRRLEKWIESVKKAWYRLGQKAPDQPYRQIDDTFGVAEDFIPKKDFENF